MGMTWTLRGRLPIVLALAWLLFAGGASSAAERPEPSGRGERTLTLAEAYRLALKNYEGVAIAKEGVDQAEAGVDKALSAILPKLTAEGAYTQYTEQKKSGVLVLQPDNASRIDVKLTQPIYSGGTEWSARRQAKMRLEKGATGLTHAKQTVLLQTARIYFNALKFQKDVEIKKAALKRAEERKKVAEARYKVGEVTRSAVLRAEAELAKAEAELIKAASAVKDAATLLKRYAGLNYDVTLEEPGIDSDATMGVEEFVRIAEAKRLDYKQAGLDEKIAREGIDYAKGMFWPSLRVEGGYTWREQDPKTTFFLKESVSASVVLSFPLFEGGLRKAELTEARSRYREAEARRRSVKSDVEVDVRRAYNNLESVNAVMESYKRQLSFAEEDYKMVFEQFKFGLATTVDVIDADASLISAERSLMNAAYDRQLSILELDYSAGVLSPEAIKDDAKGR